MIRNLDPALLRAFVTVAETGGMTSAGATLHLTQAAVSQQIKRLEDGFGCSLFERDRRGLAMTHAGERLFGKAKRLLALNDEVWADMTTPTFTGQVRLGVPFDLVGTYLPPILKVFSRAYPQVEITLVCQSSPDLLEALSGGRVDIALVEEPVGRSAGECLATERLVWVGGRGGEAHLKRPLPISLGADTCAFRPTIIGALREQGIAWRSVVEIGNVAGMLATVQTDLAVTAALPSTLPPGVEVLSAESGLPSLPSFAINLHLPRAAAGAVVQAMARHIRDGFIGRRRQAA